MNQLSNNNEIAFDAIEINALGVLVETKPTIRTNYIKCASMLLHLANGIHSADIIMANNKEGHIPA